MVPTAVLGSAAGMTKAVKPRDLQPVMTFGKAAASCADQGRLYGACILSQYETLQKDVCQREFRAFKDCVQSKVSSCDPIKGQEVAIRRSSTSGFAIGLFSVLC